MTEEIIIDGVDVKGCEYYIQDYQRANNIEGRYEHCKDVCELNGDNYFYCKMNKNCHYKQLKRLEQENKELKELNKKICEDLEKEIKVYWNALEEILEIIKADCKGCTAECDCDYDCTRYKIKNKIKEVLEC